MIDPFSQLRRLQGKRERAIQEVDFIDIQGENMQLDSSTVLKSVTDDAPIRPKMVSTFNLQYQIMDY